MNEAKFDTFEEMSSKCSHLVGLDSLILNQTTVSDIYSRYDKEQIKEDLGWRLNIDDWCHRDYKKISEEIHWKALTINHYSTDFYGYDVKLDFFNDTLVQISYRYAIDGDRDVYPEYFITQYGYGIKANYEYLDSLKVLSYTYPYNSHRIKKKYQNGDINMVVDCEYYDVIILHMPKFYEFKMAVDSVYHSRDSYQSHESSIKRGHNSMDKDDDEYWESINRENALKDAGMHEAAEMERKARMNYLKGGGYTSPSGGSQVHYQGSQEQKRDLEEMDRRGW